MIEMTSEGIDTTVESVERDMSFIEAGDRDKLLLVGSERAEFWWNCSEIRKNDLILNSTPENRL